MPRVRHSKEAMIEQLKSLAERLGKSSLTKREVRQYLDIGISSINYHFGSLGNALEASGLERGKPGPSESRIAESRLSDDQLFASLFDVEAKLGRPPGFNEYSSLGAYSYKPFKKRFGKWPEVLRFYNKWKQDTGHIASGAQTQAQQMAKDDMPPLAATPVGTLSTKATFKPLQLYGESIDFRGLRHAPTNEQGVVYLFGMISRELGFSVEVVQQGFPDCEAKILHDPKKNLWAKARIEFEFKSSTFLEHGHNPDECDFIVCWEHDWPDCPVTVIELKKEILKLPSK